MSIAVIAEVWDRSSANGTTLLVMLALADYASDDGVCFPYQQTLAEKGRCDEKTVRRAITAMREAGELDVWEWYDKRGGRKRNCYRLTVGGLDVYRGIEPEDIRERASLLRVNVPTTTRRRIFERDSWTCCECGSKTLLVIDHVVPVDAGGGSEDENLQTLCKACNTAKAALHQDESRPGEMSARVVDRPGEESGPERTPRSGPRARDPRSRTRQEDPARANALAPVDAVEAPPKLTKLANGHDLAFDALAEVCGVDPGGNRAREVGIALNGSKRSGLALGIRALVAAAARERGEPVDAGPEFEIDVADEIRAKAARYRAAMPGAALTPLALAKWWTDLDRFGGDAATRAAEEAVRLAEEGR